ncbi:MAG: ThuA domain-containing protein [Fimbriimonadaceae bacterium]|nr:ThuA domain-containing protein [Fimbriimonadaceae bacterium]
MPRALIVHGGWEGHYPEIIAEIFAIWLRADGFDVVQSADIESFRQAANLSEGDLIVPHWTMGEIPSECCQAVLGAVERGVGIAGIHGGMGDSFRNTTEWQFMVGGQFVAHPGNDGTAHTIHIGPTPHEITNGIADFEVKSEQYYMHVDPGLTVLAESVFPNPKVAGAHDGNPCRMPVVWTKSWGKGQVFYCNLGHDPSVLDTPAGTITRRGFHWAAGLPVPTGQGW